MVMSIFSSDPPLAVPRGTALTLSFKCEKRLTMTFNFDLKRLLVSDSAALIITEMSPLSVFYHALGLPP